MATSVVAEGQPSLNGIISDLQSKKLTDLPTELLEHILCFPVLKHVDICNVSCCCKRLHDVCHGRGKVWGHQYKLRCYDYFFYHFISLEFLNLAAFNYCLRREMHHPILLAFFRSPKSIMYLKVGYCELAGS